MFGILSEREELFKHLSCGPDGCLWNNPSALIVRGSEKDDITASMCFIGSLRKIIGDLYLLKSFGFQVLIMIGTRRARLSRPKLEASASNDSDNGITDMWLRKRMRLVQTPPMHRLPPLREDPSLMLFWPGLDDAGAKERPCVKPKDWLEFDVDVGCHSLAQSPPIHGGGTIASGLLIQRHSVIDASTGSGTPGPLHNVPSAVTHDAQPGRRVVLVFINGLVVRGW
ncbi:hypothetical protein V8F20_006674 [Naviculisporaceae sp. PSN 640]